MADVAADDDDNHDMVESSAACRLHIIVLFCSSFLALPSLALLCLALPCSALPTFFWPALPL